MTGDEERFLTLIKETDGSISFPLETMTQLESLEREPSELETRIPRKEIFY